MVHSCGGQGTILQCSFSTVGVLGLPSQITRVGHSVPSESSAQAVKVAITGKMTSKLLQSSLCLVRFTFFCLLVSLQSFSSTPTLPKWCLVFPQVGCQDSHSDGEGMAPKSLILKCCFVFGVVVETIKVNH